MRRIFLLLLLSTISALAQESPQPSKESALHAEFRNEGDRFHESCVNFSIGSCAYMLFTDHPLHIAAGSIAPQNGFAAGLAMVLHHDAPQWFFKWNFDGVGSTNGSWRAGVYMSIVPVPRSKPPVVVHGGGSTAPHKSKLSMFERPLFTIYAQGITLNKLGFFGIGPNTTNAGRSFFGMQETIVGGNGVVPLPATGRLGASLFGEINGRFVDIRGASGEPSPSIEQLYSPVAAPGLATQPGFIQFGEGLRVTPSLGDYLKLNYSGKFQQYVATGSSGFTFRRFTVDLNHEIPFYKTSVTNAKAGNGPDECGSGGKDLDCPKFDSISRNRYGALNLRFLLTESIASSGNTVPFYFQPTLGGSDINGSAGLPSFQDYRFRAPNVMLLHAGLEHTLFSTPVGIILGADAGKAVLARGDIGLDRLRHSYSAGLTLRAGGFPMIYVMFAYGGHEGNHIIANMNTSLLGGSARPSLF